MTWGNYEVAETPAGGEQARSVFEALEQRVAERTQEIERRRQVAEALRELLAVLNSGRTLDEILDAVVAQASRLLETDACAIYLPVEDPERGELLAVRASIGLSEEYARVKVPPDGTLTGLAFSTRRAHASRDSLAAIDPGGQRGWEIETEDRGSHVVVLHMPVALRLALPDSTGARVARVGAPAAGYRALFSVPLTARDVTYGALSLYYRHPMDFTEDQVQLATMFADQAALAIENAHLYEQAQHAAALEERQRLARDLHDAVTQTLFSTSLIADVLPELWATDQTEGLLRLQDLRRLTRGALAEMRALLVELRPGALTELPLGDLLRQLAEAASGRTRVEIEVNVCGDSTETLPPDVRIALYRIAQEALNNVGKHARAAHASVDFSYAAGRELTLRVEDDGAGFVPAQIPPGHLGLVIMRERAESVGARLSVTSQIGQGTRIEVQWTEERARG